LTIKAFVKELEMGIDMNAQNLEKCKVTRQVAEYIFGALDHYLPDEVIQKAKCHLLDTLAAVVSGSRLKAGKVAANFVLSMNGPEQASVIGTDIVSSTVYAAFANAMAAHGDETDDSHLGGMFHPGCAIVPAALSIAEAEEKSGLDLLKAIVLGYDIGARFNMALGFDKAMAGTHSTHSLGTLYGSAAAAGALMGLSVEQSIYLLSYATQQASGVPYWNRDTDHVEKAFDFAGMGARNGVYAALLVRSGFTGVSDPLINEPSYLSAFAFSPEPEQLYLELGQRFEILNATIKKWCVGSPIQAALDAVMAIVHKHNLEVDEIRSVKIHMPDDRLHIVNNREMPDVCLQHLVAVGLIDRGLNFKNCHDEARMKNPRVLELRKKITAVPSAELSIAKPARQAILEITGTDGKLLRHHTKAVKGIPDNPMNQGEITEKCLDLMAPVLGMEQSVRLVDAVWSIDTMGSAREMRPLILVPGKIQAPVLPERR